MDPATLAATAVSILLPYVGKGAEAFAQGVGKSVWERIQSVFTSERDKNELENFRTEPEIYEGVLLKRLEEKLRQDEQLAQELHRLLYPPGDTVYGVQLKNIDASGSENAMITGQVGNMHIYRSPTSQGGTSDDEV